jgi:hypothetical protein
VLKGIFRKYNLANFEVLECDGAPLVGCFFWSRWNSEISDNMTLNMSWYEISNDNYLTTHDFTYGIKW